MRHHVLNHQFPYTVYKGAPSSPCLAASESLLMTMMSWRARCLTPSPSAPSTPTIYRSDSEPDWEELRISITPPSIWERERQHTQVRAVGVGLYNVKAPCHSSKVLYSEKLLREKTFINFAVLWLFESFLCKIWGHGVLWHGKSKQSAKVFLIFTNLQKFFSLKSCLLYSTIDCKL